MRSAATFIRSVRCGWNGVRRERRVCCHQGEISDEDIRKLVGDREELVELMKKDTMMDEDDEPEFDLDEFPHRPQFLMPPSDKNTSSARLHRQTDIVKWRRKLHADNRRVPPEEDIFTEILPAAVPVPWNSRPDLRPKNPLVTFPDTREAYSESRTFVWRRHDYIAGIGEIYPRNEIEVRVTITNDVDASEKWAAVRLRLPLASNASVRGSQERLDEGHQIYGLETKWWTWDKPGVYYSDSLPGTWSDLALLQLSTEHEVLLLQPLDTPVEQLGPKLRTLLKYKFIKKAAFGAKNKAKALKQSDLQIHGCHDFAELLKLQLGVKSLFDSEPHLTVSPAGLEKVEEIPIDFEYQDLASVARLLVGLDLDPRGVVAARWEQEYLHDAWVELAAKEAWSCWALYGIVTRLEQPDVDLWCASLPDAYHVVEVEKERAERAEIKRKNTVLLPAVYEGEARRMAKQTTPNWKVAKQSAVELAHDIGLDLKWEAESEMMERHKE